jgi:DNA repair exonuclease SbcCD ATPase subunit
MNDPQTPFFSDLPRDNERVITAEIVEEGRFAAGENPIERVDADPRTLLATIARLQRELAETKERLETRTRHVKSYETLLARQNDELQRTVAEVESYREVERIQQRSLSTLSEELASAREQLARLERECTLLQENQNEGIQRALAAEKEAEELRSRLQRQQRFTLHYKTALERCTGESIPETEPIGGALVSSERPIEPWSESPAESGELVAPMMREENGDDIDEFLAEFEALDLTEPPTRGKTDWPSPVISPYIPKYSTVRVDLPTFLKNRPVERSDS